MEPPEEHSRVAVDSAESKTLLGSATPSLLASRPIFAHVDGMNCTGPTARSNSGSPSKRPPSVSLMVAVPGTWPSRRGPVMRSTVSPLAKNRPAPCWDSTWPMPATSVHGIAHPGCSAPRRSAACW